jgi:hypothetical protein
VRFAVNQDDYDNLIRYFDQAIQPYVDSTDADIQASAIAYRSLAHRFVSTAQTRYQKLLAYTGAVQQSQQLRADADQRRLEANRLTASRQELNSPALLECEATMKRAFDRIKSDVVREIDSYRRAAEYTLLANIPLKIDGQTAVGLKALVGGLKTTITDRQNEIGSTHRAFGGAKFVLNAANMGRAFGDFRSSARQFSFVIDETNNPFAAELMAITVSQVEVDMRGARVGGEGHYFRRALSQWRGKNSRRTSAMARLRSRSG